MTSPDAGNYSVTLDGITTTLSAQSSFTVPNTTLFFATGLNDSAEHLVEVKNDGGKLSILENGFEAFVTPECVQLSSTSIVLVLLPSISLFYPVLIFHAENLHLLSHQ